LNNINNDLSKIQNVLKMKYFINNNFNSRFSLKKAAFIVKH